MSNMNCATGDFVTHPRKPEWGLGKVMGVSDQTAMVVFKEDPDRGYRCIRVDIVPLAVSNEKADPVLDNLPSLEAFDRGWKVGNPNYEPLWKEICEEFRQLTGEIYSVSPSEGPFARFMQLHIASLGTGNIHYEWLLRTGEELDVALHVELGDQEESLQWLKRVADHAVEIAAGIEHRLICGPYGKLSAQATFVIPYRYELGTEKKIAILAARTMKTLIDRTMPYCQWMNQ